MEKSEIKNSFYKQINELKKLLSKHPGTQVLITCREGLGPKVAVNKTKLYTCRDSRFLKKVIKLSKKIEFFLIEHWPRDALFTLKLTGHSMGTTEWIISSRVYENMMTRAN